jgi:ABC-type uncharacterized transport system involved in gliding motility auxiliary subunit
MKKLATKISGLLGLILGIIAVVSVSAYPTKPVLNAVLTGLALLFLLIFFVFHFEAFKAFSQKRSTQLGLNSILMIALVIFIAVIFNLMAKQYYMRKDMSSTADFTLAPQTIDVIKKLQTEITVTVFGQEGSPTFEKAKELLEGYRYLNRNILYAVLDLDRSPLLAKEYEVNEYDSIVVKGPDTPIVVQGVGEETITNAIIKATRKEKKTIYFITGHGERDVYDKSREGMTKAVQKLNAIGYTTQTLTLSAVNAVPEDADVLILTGPKKKISADDLKKLHDYLISGGKLLALFDPGYHSLPITGRVGIHLAQGMVVDQSSNLGGRDEKVPLITTYPDTPVTRKFKLSTVFPGVAPLETGGLKSVYEYFSFVASSPTSRILKDDAIIGDKGGYTLAAAAGSRKGKEITIVIGDSDFISNAFFDVVGNGNLFLNSVNWLAEEGDLISITPKKDDFIPLYITPQQSRGILYLYVVGLPLSVFGIGFVIWMRRRRL